jgi:hypothetical protein
VGFKSSPFTARDLQRENGPARCSREQLQVCSHVLFNQFHQDDDGCNDDSNDKATVISSHNHDVLKAKRMDTNAEPTVDYTFRLTLRQSLRPGESLPQPTTITTLSLPPLGLLII